jgi:hypothetical protein
MFLGQRDKAKESAVKGGVHNIELGIGSYAVDHGDMYPATGLVSKATLVDDNGICYVDSWPQNPWTASDMIDDPSEGNYTYRLVSDTFELVGHGSGGSDVITAP